MILSYRNSLLLFCLIIIISCKSADPVSFKTYVDTTTKPVLIQKKQTYALDDLGVYASNNFDGARLNGLKKANDSTAILLINPENEPINNSAYYSFKVWSNTSKSFYFTFQYPKGYKHRYIPKLKKDKNWDIIDSTNVFKKDSIVTIKLELRKSPITVAAQQINSSSDVKTWYTNLIKGKEDYVHFSNFGKSRLGRNLPVLDIYKGDKKNKDVIVLLTRQHPPEVTGYFAFQEFLKAILSNSNLSNDFLNEYRVLAFPIINPDGVDLGHWRHNAGGVDTNRDWSVYNQPEVKQTVEYITKTLRKNNSKLILGLDFHSTYEDVFYTNKIREGTTLPNFIDNWFKALEQNIPNYKVNEAAGNSTKPVSKGWFLYGHNATGITYEIGDSTPKDRIQLIGKVTAEQMMSVLLNK
ncbi:M14 family metallopeptidase [Flavivirga spongiicola]|uniref:M14 family metallopeptidase n=1 Tax=Flavivirga spongiicola TaxID=421621 RepID=A0ABU7XTH8_9FLAO|nr:M14 family metallopeptidase [Flavivirga sp. MEBiC05379]MDO5979090.1 M14 family metallopeptidase [Flavivirga sp. MEBiC05379]